MRTFILSVLLMAPAGALACGGLFCDNAQPVLQAAERILFVADGDQIHMHVQLTYAGPPTNFGWLLPVPPGVETGLSSDALFAALGAAHAPRFELERRYEADCRSASERDAGGGGGMGGGAARLVDASADAFVPPDVNVISRESVGPYDRAILVPASVRDLRNWLQQNGFAIPQVTDAVFGPYLEAGAHFVAIRLLSDADSDDIVPLMLSFEADQPSIPIVPTAVAATPDMRLTIYFLGTERAVPLNYLHVVPNEAAIDWEQSGSNYEDVVAQAADEAGGQAFATDFAGPAAPAVVTAAQLLADEFLAAVEAAETVYELPRPADVDVLRVYASAVGVPDGVESAQFFDCPDCYNVAEPAVDGAALAAQLRLEVQPARAHLTQMFDAYPYLTRLSSSMSPAEMNSDPVFGFNQDLPEVPATRTAVLWVPCNEPAPGEAQGEGWNFGARVIQLPDGRSFDPQTPVQRQNGERIRGDVPAARRVEQTSQAGQPMLVSEQDPGSPGGEDSEPAGGRPPPEAMEPGGSIPTPGAQGPSSNGSGCGCDTTEGPSPALLLALLALGRRRRR